MIICVEVEERSIVTKNALAQGDGTVGYWQRRRASQRYRTEVESGAPNITGKASAKIFTPRSIARLPLLEREIWTTAIWLLLFAFLPLSASAKQPPREGCRPVSKIEYDSAKRQYLLHSRFGFYVKTGPLWGRRYWYCHR